MAREIEKIFCPSCGAPVKFMEGKEYTYCTHCGTQLFREDIHFDKRMEYLDRRDERDYELEREREYHKYQIIGTIVMTILLFGMVALIGLL